MNQSGTVETTAVVLSEPTRDVLILPDRGTLQRKLAAVRDFQALVKAHMIEGHDYGVIPGTDKPTLLKPGAEKIAKLLELADTYEIVEQTIDWDKPFFHYLIRCRLVTMGGSIVVSEGVGECNSYEGRYRYRWLFESKLPPGIDKQSLKTRSIKLRNGSTAKQYQLENEDPCSLVNTILKMAKKRAMVDASLSAGRLSDVFTQDMEDLVPEVEPVPPPIESIPTDKYDPGDGQGAVSSEPRPPQMPTDEDKAAYGRGLKVAESLGMDLGEFETNGTETRAKLLAMGKRLSEAVARQKEAQPNLV